MSNSLWPNGLQNTRLPCPSLSPRACSDSCPLSQWCHPTIIILCHPLLLQSFPASGSFPMSQFFISGGQRFGASASASILPMNIQDWFLSGLIGLISLQSKVLSRVFSKTTLQKRQSFVTQPSLWSNSHIHDYLKNHSFDYMELCWQSNVSVMTITVSSIGSGNVNALYITQYIAHSGYTVNTGWLKKNN